MVNLTRRVVAWVLILVFLITPVIQSVPRLTYAAPGDDDSETPIGSLAGAAPATVAALNALEADQNHASNLNTQAPPASPDSMYLTRQGITIFSATGQPTGNVNLSQPSLSIPNLFPRNFDTDIVTRIGQDGTVNIDLMTSNKVLGIIPGKQRYLAATHSISLHDEIPIAIERTAETVTILTRSGKLLAFDMGYVRMSLFSAPVPVFTIGQIDLSGVSDLSTIRMQHISRGKAPHVDSLRIAGNTALPSNYIAGNPENPSPFPFFTGGDLWITGHSDTLTEYSLDGHQKQTRAAQAGEDSLVAVTSFSTELEIIGKAEAVVSTLAALVSPTPTAQAAATRYMAEMEKIEKLKRAGGKIPEAVSEFQTALQQEGPNAADQGVNRALQAISDRSIKYLAVRASQSMQHASSTRDQFTFADWQESLNTAKSGATASGTGAATVPGQRFIPKNPSASGLIKLARITLGLAAGVGVVYASYTGHAPEWMVHWANSAINAVWPTVYQPWKFPGDQFAANYPINNFKSQVWLLAWIPIQITLGTLYARLLYAKGVGPIEGLVTTGARIYRVFILPLHLSLDKLGQKNFSACLRQGLNPFESFNTAQLGIPGTPTRGRMGVVGVPSLNREARAETYSLQERAIRVAGERRAQARQLAWHLAAIAASSRTGVPIDVLIGQLAKGDPAARGPVVAQAFENVAAELKAKGVPDAQLQKQTELALGEMAERTFAQILGSTRNGRDFNLQVQDANPNEITKYFNSAMKACDQVLARGSVSRVINPHRRWFLRVRLNWWHNLAIWNEEEANILSRERPSDFVSRTLFTSYVWDYGLFIFLTAHWGERARMDPHYSAAEVQANPKLTEHSPREELAANGSGLTSTNPAHNADSIETNGLYSIIQPAYQVLNYGRNLNVRENEFDPLLGQSTVPREGFDINTELPQSDNDLGPVDQNLYEEGPLRAFSHYMSSAFDLDNVGKTLWGQMVRRLKLSPANIVFSCIVAKMLILHRAPDRALEGWIYMLIFATWQFGWPWVFHYQGLNANEEIATENHQKFREAKLELEAALRLRNAEGTARTGAALAKLYEQVTLPPDLLQARDSLIALTQMTPEEWAQTVKIYSAHRDRITTFETAYTAEESAEARERLKADFISQMATEHELNPTDRQALQAVLGHADAQTLYNFALTTPPFATKFNRAFEHISTFTLAITTTLMAIPMAVISNSAHANFLEMIPKVGVISVGLYAGFYYLPDIKKFAGRVYEALPRPIKVLTKTVAIGGAAYALLAVGNSHPADARGVLEFPTQVKNATVGAGREVIDTTVEFCREAFREHKIPYTDPAQFRARDRANSTAARERGSTPASGTTPARPAGEVKPPATQPVPATKTNLPATPPRNPTLPPPPGVNPGKGLGND